MHSGQNLKNEKKIFNFGQKLEKSSIFEQNWLKTMKKQIINKFGPKKVILEKTATRTHIMYCFIFPFLSHSVWQLSILFKIERNIQVP